jgi:thiamine kinase-like enzyme
VIEDLEAVLAASGQPGLSELRSALGQALDAGTSSVACIEQRKLKSRVHRLRFRAGGRVLSVVAKRLESDVAKRCELLVRRWLPAEGLASAAPRLITASPAAGGWVWHVYEDLGEETLEHRPERDRVEAALRLVARLHERFTSHPLLEECRAASEERGITYFTRNVRDAIEALEAVRDAARGLGAEHAALCERLLARLHRLEVEAPARARSLADGGGPETLLHGDLWTSNVVVTRTAGGLEARLLDWDRLGPGPVSYDLSAFLLRFPRERRLDILALFDRAVAEEGGRPLARASLAMDLETAELSRFANRVIWPARAIVERDASSCFDELAEVERWFEALEPALDFPTSAPPTSAPPTFVPRPAEAKRLIVNADDFGATAGVNRGILEAHARGIVTSTSLMVDGVAAEAAAEASREAPSLGIGLHVDLGRTPPADAAGVRRILERQAERFVALMGRSAHAPRLAPELAPRPDRAARVPGPRRALGHPAPRPLAGAAAAQLLRPVARREPSRAGRGGEAARAARLPRRVRIHRVDLPPRVRGRRPRLQLPARARGGTRDALRPSNPRRTRRARHPPRRLHRREPVARELAHGEDRRAVRIQRRQLPERGRPPVGVHAVHLRSQAPGL